MPKKVDHEERRAIIAQALRRVAAREGLNGVSLRHVADEAGVSTGLVQHYFRTKDEMMQFVLEGLRANAGARLRAVSAQLGSTPPAAAVREVLHEMLPLDDERDLEGHVVLALYAYASTSASAATAQRDGYSQLVAFLAGQIRLGETNRSPEDHDHCLHDPEQEAGALLALVEGLNLTVLMGYHTRESARRTLDSRLRELFGESALDAVEEARTGSRPATDMSATRAPAEIPTGRGVRGGPGRGHSSPAGTTAADHRRAIS